MLASSGKSMITDREDECDWVTNTIRRIFQIVNYVVICQIIDVFGTVTYIINIICFVKQGLRDPVNISLLALTITDLFSLVAIIWMNISVNPWISETDTSFDFQQTSYLTGAVPHGGFTRVTCWITAFIALERCLCVALPVKIKRLITPKKVIVIITIIYLIIFFGYITPPYYNTRFEGQPHPRKPNTTWLGIRFTEDRLIVEIYAYAINNCLLPFSAFTVISVSTVLLVVKLKTQSNWRRKFTAPGISDSISSRDQSVSRMVVMISTMFIICYAPVCLIFISIIAIPKSWAVGIYGNIYAIVFSFAYILESINASFNIFIYYKVSSRYRQTFRQTFGGHWGRNKVPQLLPHNARD